MNQFLNSYLLHNSVFKGNLKCEDLLAYQVATYLREQSLANKLPFVWFHVANEFASKNKTFGAKLSAQGRLTGVADYIFLGKNKCFALELKYGKGKQSEAQKSFENWCKTLDVPYFVAYSLNESINYIKNMSDYELQCK